MKNIDINSWQKFLVLCNDRFFEEYVYSKQLRRTIEADGFAFNAKCDSDRLVLMPGTTITLIFLAANKNLQKPSTALSSSRPNIAKLHVCVSAAADNEYSSHQQSRFLTRQERETSNIPKKVPSIAHIEVPQTQTCVSRLLLCFGSRYSQQHTFDWKDLFSCSGAS